MKPFLTCCPVVSVLKMILLHIEMLTTDTAKQQTAQPIMVD